jgi:hypothetical protein
VIVVTNVNPLYAFLPNITEWPRNVAASKEVILTMPCAAQIAILKATD